MAFRQGCGSACRVYLNLELMVKWEYDSTLRYLEQYGRIEASFASKLIAAINPNKPVIDRYVLNNIEMRLPHTYTKNRFEKTVEVYRNVESWYQKFSTTEDASIMINIFNKTYTNNDIMISIIESIAQAENESRSTKVILQRAKKETSKKQKIQFKVVNKL